MSRTPKKRLAVIALVAGGALALAAGCGTKSDTHNGHATPSATASTSASGPAVSGRNDADIAFARDMIPHHRQAIEMAVLGETRAADARVKNLISRIKGAQDPEIAQLSNWLREWGQPVPSAGPDAGHGGHGGPSMPGMMSAADMEALKAASGKAFDRKFVELMIRHHQGAIEMANTEKQKGAHAGAKKMAESIATSQAAEVQEMQTLLPQL